MCYGIMFALAYLVAQRHGIPEELYTTRATLLASLLAVIAMAAYVALALLCDSSCDEIHSYVAWLPIAAYVMLRNLGSSQRSSALFRWVGAITLELFASHSHIWLAADTHGVLVLVPGSPVLNLMITSYVFVFAAHEIRKLTQVILPYAVPDDWRLVLRNFAIFLAVLVPIGIHDGMF